MGVIKGQKTKRSFESHLSNVYTEPNTGCWLWPATVNPQGYGLAFNGSKFGLAHRMSYELHKGSIPDGYSIRNLCDVPSCVNPDHLRIGTHAQNMHDMYRRNRCSRTSPYSLSGAEGATPMSQERANMIRRESGMTQSQIAMKYGISQSTVSLVRSNKIWKEQNVHH